MYSRISRSRTPQVFDTSYFRSWEELEKNMLGCTKCLLHRYRKNAVPGEGSKNTLAMLIGEAPGTTEDEMGRPFVGAAGRLLTQALENIGMSRNDVYITNVIKCRPPQNREPNDEEIESCSIYLESQILLIKPKIIMTLGNVAGRKIFALGSRQWDGVMKMRGKVYQMNILGLNIHIVPTIHPAAALYNPQLRDLLFSDLRRFKELLVSIIVQDREGVRKGVKTIMDYVRQR